eukprot:11218340-Lingulodinium_polyedra.AAC.1
MDKSTVYNVAILWDALEHFFDGKDYSDILIWSDCGSNFRSTSMVGTGAHRLFEHYPTLKRVRLEFGAPKHFKSVCDG